MRLIPSFLLLVGLCLLPGLCFPQGQATLPDVLRSDEPAKPAPSPKKPAPSAPAVQAPKAPQAKTPEGDGATAKPLAAHPFVSSSLYLDSSKYTTQFEDRFVDNRNHWETADRKEWKGEIRDGGYILEHKRKDLTWIRTLSMGFDPSANYVVEMEYTVVSGADDVFVGLVIGYDMEGEILKFQRCSTTLSGVFSYVERVWNMGSQKVLSGYDLTTKKELTNFNKGFGKKNTMKAIHYGDKMYLFVNGVQVAECDYKTPPGKKLGFTVGMQGVAKINYFAYKTIAP